MSVAAANREVYLLLKEGVPVSVPDRERGGQRTLRVRVIDWKNVANNDFLCVSYLHRAAAAGLTWPVPEDLDDGALEARLFARPATSAARDRVIPEWATLHHELKKPGVTLALLWTEYRGQHPTGYAYSQFCERYRRWARALKPSMRQVHRAGEKLFVDFSGKRPHLVDPTTGELVVVELFVGVLGASGLIYAEATRSQDLASWVGAHVRMLDYFQGSPAIWVPDNLKSGVTTAHRYEPEINRTYAELAQHCGAVVIPARVATPTDKPKVEVSVQIAQRWILAALRHQTFFTLADLNAAIDARVDAINARPMQGLGVSRRTLFEQVDRSALRPLPRTRYELATWQPCRVNIFCGVPSYVAQRDGRERPGFVVQDDWPHN